jgi:hypothetical protein
MSAKCGKGVNYKRLKRTIKYLYLNVLKKLINMGCYIAHGKYNIYWSPMVVGVIKFG